MTIVKSASASLLIPVSAWVFILMLFFSSCKEENHCDTSSYAPPELELLNFTGNEVEWPADSMLTLRFSMKAEAGLNTFSMNGQPVNVFTGGESDLVFEFSRYFWESEELHFLLYDLCNQEAELLVQMNVFHSQ